MPAVVLVHYDEVALKQGARGFFERHLLYGLENALPGEKRPRVRRLFGRVVVELPPGSDVTKVAARLALVPGVSNTLEAAETEDDSPEGIAVLVREEVAHRSFKSFAIRVKRADKSYPLRSAELERRLGAVVLETHQAKVDLKNPELKVVVELTNGRALVGSQRHDGFGGLPVGTSGRAVALLSGGIDSPVAAWMMMSRGLRLTLVHFHSEPFTTRASREKVRDLAATLTQFQPRIALVNVPFADPVQRAIVENCEERLRVVLYRRFMIRIAERVAAWHRATCLVTGEALGQVASQTLENLSCVEAAATLPVLRPLIGMGKRRIIDLAQELGTFETSIKPHEDCCTFLMPRSPSTRTRLADVLSAESALEVNSLVETAFSKREESVLRIRDRIGGTLLADDSA